MNPLYRKIAVAGVLSAITIVLGITHLGFIPWFGGVAITIMHVPVILGAILEGPIVGVIIGGLFGLFSLIQAAAAPTGPIDLAFTNPLISILPRLIIGLVTWLVYRAIAGRSGSAAWRVIPALLVSAIAGSLANTGLVLSGLGLFKFFSWPVIAAAALANGPLEAVAAAVIVLPVVVTWKSLNSGKKAKLAEEEGR